MLKFYCMGYYNWNVDSGLPGQYFRNEIGVGFLIEPPLKSSPNNKMLLLSKRGAIYLLKSAQKSWSRYFGEALEFEVVVPQLRTFHMDLHPPTHAQLNILMDFYLGYDVFECHANF